MMKSSALLALCLGAALSGAAFSGTAKAQNLGQQFPVRGDAATSPRPRGPMQDAIAAKGAFPVAKAADIKGAVPATNLAGAQKLINKPVTVVGTVTSVFAPRSGSLVLLNFAKNYKTAVVGYVKKSDFAKFPALKNLKGKKVALHGKMVLFKGAPEVELASAGAIRLVK